MIGKITLAFRSLPRRLHSVPCSPGPTSRFRIQSATWRKAWVSLSESHLHRVMDKIPKRPPLVLHIFLYRTGVWRSRYSFFVSHPTPGHLTESSAQSEKWSVLHDSSIPGEFQCELNASFTNFKNARLELSRIWKRNILKTYFNVNSRNPSQTGHASTSNYHSTLVCVVEVTGVATYK